MHGLQLSDVVNYAIVRSNSFIFGIGITVVSLIANNGVVDDACKNNGCPQFSG